MSVEEAAIVLGISRTFAYEGRGPWRDSLHPDWSAHPRARGCPQPAPGERRTRRIGRHL